MLRSYRTGAAGEHDPRPDESAAHGRSGSGRHPPDLFLRNADRESHGDEDATDNGKNRNSPHGTDARVSART